MAYNTTTEIANEQANIQILEKDQELLDYAYMLKTMREGYEPMAYLSRRAYEGKHFTAWNKDLKKLVEIPQKKSMPTSLPEIKNQADKFENFLLKTDLVFTLVPAFLSQDDAVKESMILSRLAKYYHERLRDTTVMSDWIHYAIVDSNVSFIEVTPDTKEKDVVYHTWDFFDILFNPLIRKWEDQTIICKIVKKNINDLKRSSLYTLPTDYKPAGVGGDWRSWKDVWEAERYQSFADLDKDMTVIFEFHILTKDDGLKIRTLDAAGNVIRNSHYPAVKRMSVQPLRIYSGEWWQPGYVYQLIPMNRFLDMWANRMDDLFLRLTKGGYFVQEEENIDGEMNEEMGQIIRYAANKPEPITMGTVPNFFVELFGVFQNLSERYGLNSIFSGQMPQKSSSLRSNKMIDNIKGLTQDNNSSIMINMQASIKAVLEITFAFLYELWDEPQDKLEADGMDQSPLFVSKKFADLHTQDNVFAIPDKFKKFTVEVDNGLGYTLKERQSMAVQLYNLKDEQGKPVLSSTALKKIFKMGASGYLMEADDIPMHQTKEFQQLIGSFGSMDDQQKQSLVTMLHTIGQQQAAATPPGQVGEKMIQGVQGGQGGGQPPPPGGAPPEGGGGQ